jgi:glycosyltransferase A (GT-A) superfamily protein (DUF2064 family)
MGQIMENDSRSLAIIVFLRCPKPGQVKTRLAKSIGNENACLLYKLCAERVLKSLLCDSEIPVYVFYSVKEEESDVQDWLDASLVGCSPAGMFAQKQVDCLGDRIMDAIDVVSKLRSGLDGDTIVGVVGTDVPDLTGDVVRKGAQAIEGGAGKMAVLGPSVDGGFYMMLLRVPVQDGGCRLDMLDGIEWSTDTVCLRTEEALKHSGYSVVSNSGCVPVLRDIDELHDIIEWNNNNKDDDEFSVAVKRVVTEYHDTS